MLFWLHRGTSTRESHVVDESASFGAAGAHPSPQAFPGLEPGDRWCVCVPRWLEAREADVAPPIVPEATARSVLTHVPLSTIDEYASE